MEEQNEKIAFFFSYCKIWTIFSNLLFSFSLEPSITNQTSHSLRNGFRKRELNDEELRDVISELMPLVRICHIIPPDSEILANAKEGLFQILSIGPYSVNS